MERDFMGLSLKESLAVVKEEIHNDGCKDSGSAPHGPFTKKIYGRPPLMSFKISQDDKTKKIISDPLISNGFIPISSADVFGPCQQLSAGEYQDVHSVHNTHDLKMLSGSNQAISISLAHPFFKNNFATAAQNSFGAKMKLLGAVDSFVGNTEPGILKPSGPPAPLTIFYAGTVNVFHDISPEKAQAIMFLARNAPSVVPNTAHPKVQAPSSKLAGNDGVSVNQPINAVSCSGLSSPLSVSSHTGALSGSGSNCTDEFLAGKTTGVPMASVGKVEPPIIVNATTMLPSAIPQARKASLARFLEKRKERVMNAAPYNLNKKSKVCNTQESDGANFSAITTGNTVTLEQGE